MKKFINEIVPYVIIILAVALIRIYIVTPVKVDGLSMYPTLSDNQVLLLKKYKKTFKRFDIVVLDYQNNKLVKRIIGLPGEHIEYNNGNLYVNGKKIDEKFLEINNTDDFNINIFNETIPDDYYFVMGDNRPNSKDSRIIGFIKKEDIEGKVDFSIFPLNKFGKIK